MMNILDSDVQFRQLGERDVLTEEQLRDVSRLIYDTDDYIYPAMFPEKGDALRLISEMFRMGDEMFRPEHLFIAFAGEQIIGLILWKRGSMNWTSEVYEEAARQVGIAPSQYLEQVKDGYFASYTKTDQDTIAVINVCVSERSRGVGVGRRLMEAFLRETAGGCARYELFVLADNHPACKLYTDAGFQVTEELQGFSVDSRDLRCYRMIRA